MTDQQNVTDGIPSDAASNDAVLHEALGVIDGALAKMMQRDLVSTGEVADLLLDVRTLLTDVHLAPAVEINDIEPVPSELS
ncbi:hypothetical protein [Ilumatobacter nonamiensis]|uniref:hypothetical protein n=1 Tax=Ilumatobacter nonamiensis TaxID=467093 RepID=UPI00034DA4AA|nr:hypothetical protein [Ilumatobacter nonamiensis]